MIQQMKGDQPHVSGVWKVDGGGGGVLSFCIVLHKRHSK